MHSIVFRLLFLVFALGSVTVLGASSGASKAPWGGPGYRMNRGQWPQHVLALHQQPGLDIWITTQGWVYDRYAIRDTLRSGTVVTISTAFGPVTALTSTASSSPVVRHRGDSLGAHHHDDVSQVASITRYHGTIRVLDTIDAGLPRYDVFLPTAALLSTTTFSVKGALALRMASDSGLVISTPQGSIVHGNLAVFEVNRFTGQRQRRSATMTVNGSAVGFVADILDTSNPVIIDPIVTATYVADVTSCFPLDVAELPNGSIVVGGALGSSTSIQFPTQEGSYQRTTSGENDCFLMVLNAAMTEVQASTLFGGSADDELYGLAITPQGTIVATGFTTSNDFPVTPNAHQRTRAGGQEMFVVEFDAACRELLHSTYHGGTSREHGFDILADTDSTVMVVGRKQSPLAPIGGPDVGPGGALDGGLIRLHLRTGELLRAFRIGTAANDDVRGLARGADGTWYICGSLGDSLFRGVTATPDRPRGGTDAFVLRMDASLVTPLATIRLGGDSADAARSVVVDSRGVVLCGTTSSPTYPTTVGAYRERFGGESDIFVTRLTSGLDRIQHSTFIGGSGTDHAQESHSLAVFRDSLIAVKGFTTSTNLAIPTPAIQSERSGFSDFYLAILSPELDTLPYATLYGGAGEEGRPTNAAPGALTITRRGTLLSVCSSTSTNLSVTPNTVFANPPATRAFRGFILDVYPFEVAMPPSQSTDTICAGSEYRISWTESSLPDDSVDIAIFTAENDRVATLGKERAARREYTAIIPSSLQEGLYRVVVEKHGSISSARAERRLFVQRLLPLAIEQRRLINCNPTAGIVADISSSRTNAKQFTWFKNGSVLRTGSSRSIILEPPFQAEEIISVRAEHPCGTDSAVVLVLSNGDANVALDATELSVRTKRGVAMDTSFVIINNASQPARIRELRSSARNVTITAFDSIIAPGSSARIPVTFDGKEQITAEITGVIVSNVVSQCDRDIRVVIRTTLDRYDATITVNNQEFDVYPADAKPISLTLTPSIEEIRSMGVWEIRGELVYSSIHLVPQSANQRSAEVSGNTVLPFVVRLDSVSSTFWDISMLPMVTPDTTTTISVQNIQCNPSNLLNVASVPGKAQFRGHCLVPVRRGVLPTGMPTLRLVVSREGDAATVRRSDGLPITEPISVHTMDGQHAATMWSPVIMLRTVPMGLLMFTAHGARALVVNVP